MRTWTAGAVVVVGLTLAPPSAQAAEIKVLTAGAMRGVVVALQPEFERAGGDKLTVDNDTAGGLSRRIGEGESCDLVVATPGALRDLAAKGKVAGESVVPVARVAIGVVVKAGAPKPDIGTVEAFTAALRNARSVAYIDPASGGSSGIYLARLFERLGLAEELKPKARLKRGGYVADLVASGEAELGIHQISEILPVAGTVLVGPLPEAIQNYTDYAGGLCGGSPAEAAARRVLRSLTAPEAKRIIEEKGMAPAS